MYYSVEFELGGDNSSWEEIHTDEEVITPSIHTEDGEDGVELEADSSNDVEDEPVDKVWDEVAGWFALLNFH